MKSPKWLTVDAVAGAAALATLLASSPPAFAQRDSFCASEFRFVKGGVTEVQAQTRRDQVCMINYGKRSTIMSYTLVRPAANGVVGSAGNSGGRYRTAYRPRPGFVGPDSWEADIVYVPARGGRSQARAGEEQRTRMRVQMSVRP